LTIYQDADGEFNNNRMGIVAVAPSGPSSATINACAALVASSCRKRNAAFKHG
jgi:hypothetical protein